MTIVDVLSGRAGLAGVQRVLLGAPVRRVLRHELRAALAAPGVLGACRLRRAKFKPGRKLTAWYDVYIRTPGAAKERIRPIAVTWTPPGDGPLPAVPPGLARAQAAAVRRGLAAPFERLRVDATSGPPGWPAAWGMRIQVWPLDEQFGQLVRVSDPRHVRYMLAAAHSARSTPHAALGRPAADYAVTPIRYRPGERHVLRYDAIGPPERAGAWGMVFAKLYRDEAGARSFRVAAGVADWLAACGSHVTAVRPLAYVAADRIALYPYVAGSPLSRRFRSPSQGTAQHLANAGAALHALHRAPASLARDLERQDFAAEVKLVARASEHIHALLPAAGTAIADLLDRAQALHARLPEEPPAFAHADFKADHLLVSPAGLTLIDFDTCCLADPALDLGKFLADLQWWHIAYGRPGAQWAQDRFLDGYGRGVPEARLEARLLRARLYEAVQLVKLAARRVRLFDPDWALGTEQLIDRARASLQALQGTMATQVA